MEETVIIAMRPNRRAGNPAKPRRERNQRRRIYGPRDRLRAHLTCREEVELISQYLAAVLDRSARRAFESHLAICPDCAAFLHTYKKTLELNRIFLARPARQLRPLA
jgi:Putative zinc-finger